MNVVLGCLVTLSLLAHGHSALKSGEEAAAASVIVTVPAPAVGFGAFTFVQPRRPAGQTVPKLERGPCNMPVIRADAGVDPKMIIPIEQGEAEAKIRVIEPTICWEKAKEEKK